ncbi:hypothetical protein O6H91_14G044200 [Diphasiastrum complanatum]|nr:hypothetical protein O6H91_14G044200 [Diphasiastrum complanatum]
MQLVLFLSFMFLLMQCSLERELRSVVEMRTLDVALTLQASKPFHFAESSLNYEQQQQQKRGSFRLNLVHRDANTSPFRLQNATRQQLLKQRLIRDEARVKWISTPIHRLQASESSHLQSSSSRSSAEGLASPVLSGLSFGSAEYFVRLGVGTPAKPIYMVIDTGSDVPWLQCKPCRRCYDQNDPIFDPKQSSSYQQLKCTSQQCRQLTMRACQDKQCMYEIFYGDGSFTAGNLAMETFSVGDSAVERVAFGCGHDNEGLFVGAGGLLGLGAGALSFSSQASASRFSYCLIDRESGALNSSSALIFGNASIPAGARFTRLLRNQKHATYYYVALTGISVGGLRLPIRAEAFRLSASGGGGVIIDSGTSVTRLAAPAYYLLRNAFRQGTRHLPAASGFSLFDTCYDFSRVKSVDVPTVAFHFAGAIDLQLQANNYLLPVDDSGTFCFAFAGTSLNISIIGNIQQQGTRIAIDGQARRVAFIPQECG